MSRDDVQVSMFTTGPYFRAKHYQMLFLCMTLRKSADFLSRNHTYE